MAHVVFQTVLSQEQTPAIHSAKKYIRVLHELSDAREALGLDTAQGLEGGAYLLDNIHPIVEGQSEVDVQFRS